MSTPINVDHPDMDDHPLLLTSPVAFGYDGFTHSPYECAPTMPDSSMWTLESLVQDSFLPSGSGVDLSGPVYPDFADLEALIASAADPSQFHQLGFVAHDGSSDGLIHRTNSSSRAATHHSSLPHLTIDPAFTSSSPSPPFTDSTLSSNSANSERPNSSHMIPFPTSAVSMSSSMGDSPVDPANFYRGFHMPTSNMAKWDSDSSSNLSDEQLLDAAIAAETQRQSLAAQQQHQQSIQNDINGHRYTHSRHTSNASSTFSDASSLYNGTPHSAPHSISSASASASGEDYETDPALIPRAIMRPNAVRASQACVACRKRKVRCVPYEGGLVSSSGSWRKARKGEAATATAGEGGKCCARCAKIGQSCVWAEERRGRRADRGVDSTGSSAISASASAYGRHGLPAAGNNGSGPIRPAVSTSSSASTVRAGAQGQGWNSQQTSPVDGSFPRSSVLLPYTAPQAVGQQPRQYSASPTTYTPASGPAW